MLGGMDRCEALEYDVKFGSERGCLISMAIIEDFVAYRICKPDSVVDLEPSVHQMMEFEKFEIPEK